MASAIAGSIAGSIGSSLLSFGASLLTSKGTEYRLCFEQFSRKLNNFIVSTSQFLSKIFFFCYFNKSIESCRAGETKDKRQKTKDKRQKTKDISKVCQAGESSTWQLPSGARISELDCWQVELLFVSFFRLVFLLSSFCIFLYFLPSCLELFDHYMV